MYIAICMAEGENVHKLMDCIHQQKTQYPCLCDCYHNPFDCLENFVAGRYDALFFDSQLSPSNVTEITQADGQIRLVALVEDHDDAPSEMQGIWGFLSNPAKPVFVRSLLERLHQETTTRDSHSIAIKARGKVLRIPFDHIEYVEALGRNIIFHLTDGREEEVVGTLSGYADRLLELPDFVKTHRSYLVNLRCVQKLTKEGIHTATGAFVPVAVNGYAQFKKDYMQSMMLLPDVEPTKPAPPSQLAPHILLVDDDGVELERWGGVLLAQGCVVATATNEETALCLLGKQRYDCVILDVQLGSGSGFDLHQRIKHLTHAPVLYLSTLGDFEHQARGFQGGGVDYITKDVSGELFWLKVQSRIKASTAPLTTASCGYLVLHIDTREATLGGIPLPLTVVEFNLLHLFVRNPNTIYAPTELYRRIWGKDTGDIEQVIQLHLSSLSQKLNQVSPHHRYIKAVWGKGYRLDPDSRGGDVS